MVNVCTLIGNLGQDPELRNTNSGTSVCQLSVATSSRIKKGEDWIDEVEWHRCVLFGKNAENAAKFLQKGRQVYINGRIHYGKYTDKNGVEKYTTDIIVNEIKFLGSGGGKQEGGQRREPTREVKAQGEPIPFDDDLPF